MTKRNVTLLLLVALAALVLDQVSKYLIVRYLQHPGNSTQVLGRFVIFELIYNRAGVFGIQFGRSLTYLIFPILGILLVILFASSAQHPGFSVCYGLILGGAFGNLIDRLFRPQGVVDFISPQFIHFRIAGRTFGMERWFTFNVADACLVIGIVLLLFFETFTRRVSDLCPVADSGTSQPSVQTGNPVPLAQGTSHPSTTETEPISPETPKTCP